MTIGRVKWCALEIALVIGIAIAAAPPAAAQISMQRPGLTGIPQGKKKTAPVQSSTALTQDEEKRLTAVIHHMSPKQRRKLNQALKKMTPQQRQQLLASVKQQLAKPTPKAEKRGW
jgi:hypothetical protein